MNIFELMYNEGLKEGKMEISKRYRVNVSMSVKGIKTYDCTVDIARGDDYDNGLLRNEVLTESDALVAELDRRYPPPIDEKK